MAVDQNENRVRDNVRRAIEVMTAWTVDPDKQFTWSRFIQNVTEEPDGAIQMLMGFVTLGGPAYRKNSCGLPAIREPHPRPSRKNDFVSLSSACNLARTRIRSFQPM